MKNNKMVLPVIIILLIIFLPLTVIGSYKSLSKGTSLENPSKEHKYNNKLFYYDSEGKLLGTYECTSSDCDDAQTEIDDEINDFYKEGDKNDIGVFNTDNVFIKDNDKIYLRLERVNNNYNYDSKNILATEIGAIYKYRDSNLISDYYLNVVNNYSIKFLLDNGVKRVTLSPEVNYNYLDDYILDKVELIIYGTIENMITKSCPIKELKICPCKKEDIYYLEDINKNRYRVLHNNCLTHIMHYKKINYIDNISYYKNLGIRSYRLELLDESYEEVIRLIDEIRKK